MKSNVVCCEMATGWIEFADKKIAKKVAESLNNTTIGGRKGDFYHDDIWNLKYLKGFKYVMHYLISFSLKQTFNNLLHNMFYSVDGSF